MSSEGDTAVAFLGLGRMGRQMARRVAEHGFATTVWNRTPRPDAVPAAAQVAASPRAAVAGADVIVTMLADGAALAAVLDDVLAGAEPGAVLVDMSTIGPEAARAVGARCAAAGVGFLDAPVSGSTAHAESGQLVAMVGGDEQTLDRVRPLLSAMTREQLHLGDSGAGAAMKLALNLAVAVTNQSVAETLALAQRAGIPPERAYDVLAAGALASPFVAYKRDAFLSPEGAPVAFSIDLMAKDVALALDVAAAAGLELPVADAVREALERARRADLGERDIARVLETYER